MATSLNSFNTLNSLTVNGETFQFFDLQSAELKKLGDIGRLPFSLKVLLENLLRFEDDKTVTADDIKAIASWLENKTSTHEIAYRPTRVLMQDFTGVPAIVDLAAMRSAMSELGGDPNNINPLSPVDLVIDHSVQVDRFASPDAYELNTQIEMQRNQERYEFLRWGQQAFDNFRVVPPGTGICHQVNLEYLGQCVWQKEIDGEPYVFPDTLVGTDSHTTMINGLGILGWGVGGIEAEAAMLGQPISMLIPDVIGFRLTGELREGITATDLVLTVTQMLRTKGVVGKFVEFYGDGLQHLALADRATLANMSPEFGATCGFFPIDKETVKYLQLTSRNQKTIDLVEAYCKAQGLWHDENTPDPTFTDTLELDLNSVQACVAGPKRPQDKVILSELPANFADFLAFNDKLSEQDKRVDTAEGYDLGHGDIVIAAITSCTNTSNPSVLMAAGLVAKNAIEKGLRAKPWVKSSLAPGSKVVTEYLEKAGLQRYLDELGFSLVGYGCTTCIGNSGPLPKPIQETIDANDLVVSAVLSGNRNFEGRIHPQVKANWLASPPLVVAYALAGSTKVDLHHDPLGQDQNGNDIFLRDIWPTNQAVAEQVALVSQSMFHKEYADVFTGNAAWREMQITQSQTYNWHDSTYIQHPPFFAGMSKQTDPIKPITGASILALLGDSITTDHISPAGAIKADSPAGSYLEANGVEKKDFNSYGSRRGNHEVMMRGTFANIRIRNEMVPETEGGFTRYIPSGETMPIYDAAMRYQQEGISLIVIAGKEYGTGSSRDWAAKGTRLLGVKAVIAESFERIHRSNLIGMGVLPLQFQGDVNRKSLQLDGSETVNLPDLSDNLKAGDKLKVVIHFADGRQEATELLCRIDTQNELAYYQHGGILHYVLRKLLTN